MLDIIHQLKSPVSNSNNLLGNEQLRNIPVELLKNKYSVDHYRSIPEIFCKGKIKSLLPTLANKLFHTLVATALNSYCNFYRKVHTDNTLSVLIDSVIDEATRGVEKEITRDYLAMHVYVDAEGYPLPALLIPRVAAFPTKNYNYDYDTLKITMEFKDTKRIEYVIPLKFLLKCTSFCLEGYSNYKHTIYLKRTEYEPLMLLTNGELPTDAIDKLTTSLDVYEYVGVTSRNWLIRLKEHLNGISSMSNKRFYKKFREELKCPDGVLKISFELVDIVPTYKSCMDWEEKEVDREYLGIKKLNMIPGGFKGLKLLHRLGYLSRLENLTDTEVDAAKKQYFKENPRTSLTSKFVYHSVFKRSNTLDSVEEVEEIRWLCFKGMSNKEVATLTRRSYSQICDVISNRTYKDRDLYAL